MPRLQSLPQLTAHTLDSSAVFAEDQPSHVVVSCGLAARHYTRLEPKVLRLFSEVVNFSVRPFHDLHPSAKLLHLPMKPCLSARTPGPCFYLGRVSKILYGPLS